MVPHIAASGYAGLVVSLPAADVRTTADTAADHLEAVRDAHGLVPPVAQKYLESYSLARLVMVDPVPPHTFGPALARLRAQGPAPGEACLIDALLRDGDAAAVRLEPGAVPMLVVTTPGSAATADDVAATCAFHDIPPTHVVAAPSSDANAVADIILQWVDMDM